MKTAGARRMAVATSVRARLTLWNVVVLALALVVVGGILRYTVKANLTAAVDRSLREKAERVLPFWPLREEAKSLFVFLRALRDPTGHPLFPGLSLGIDTMGLVPRLLTLDGKSFFGGHPVAPWDARAFARAARGQTSSSTVWVNGEEIRVYSLPLRTRGAVDAVLQWPEPLTAANEEVARLTRTLLALIPVALLIAGAGGAFLTNRALLPVRRITDAAARIEAQTLSGRLPVAGQDEFAALSATFNGMLARLETAFEQQSRFTADASHELRTPLAIARARTTLSLSQDRTAAEYRRTLEIVDESLERLGQVVQDLLFLARADREREPPEVHPLAAAEVLRGAREALGSAEALPEVRVEVPDPSPAVLGNPEQLARLFRNLLENAIRHTPPDGRITLSARADGESEVILAVSDTGEGIAPEHLPHVTERFYRVDSGRARAAGGAGLGLAICRSIAEAHGGTMRIRSAPGQGTTVEVTLPRAPSALGSRLSAG
jgi:heavy metal sensor kinase